jgi:hypothetical protein
MIIKKIYIRSKVCTPEIKKLKYKSGTYIFFRNNTPYFFGYSNSNLFKTILRHFQGKQPKPRPDTITAEICSETNKNIQFFKNHQNYKP